MSGLDACLAAFPELSLHQASGSPVLHVATAHAHARVSLHGGQLLSFVPHGFEDLLWMSDRAQPPPHALRGGVPVCWPYFGRHGQPAHVPQHGFARNALWTLSKVERQHRGLALHLALPTCTDTSLHLTQVIEVGPVLRQSLTTTNSGDAVQAVTCALHSYFQVADVTAVRVLGVEGLHYADKHDGQMHAQEEAWHLHEPRDPGRSDRIYANAGDSFDLLDPVARRRISLRTFGSRSLVLWNPGAVGAAAMPDVGAQWSRFLCLEAANAGDDVVMLAPGATHVLSHMVQAVAWPAVEVPNQAALSE